MICRDDKECRRHRSEMNRRGSSSSFVDDFDGPACRELSLVNSPCYERVPLDFTVRGDAHPCPYLPGREATEQLFRALEFPAELYHDFMDHEFRRSGLIIYRPTCSACRECRPLRIPVGAFGPNKAQRRILKKNRDLEVFVNLPTFSRDKYRLYREYLSFKHDSTSCDSPSALKGFLYMSPVKTLEFEYRLGGRLVAVGIADVCSRSLSSVYAFYAPDMASRSLGTFSALQEISFCRDHGIPYYYLGFTVRDCPSMNYKSNFQPHEILDCSLQWVAQGKA